MRSSAEVLVIGGGPSGLTFATELRARTSARVVVLEREAVAGGIPRHSDHPGYGIRDMRTFISGPKYAGRLRSRAVKAGVELRTNTMVTDWADEHSVWCTSPEGRYRITADAIVLATGARERPRTARMIPGSRPRGVFTTGELQNHVHIFGQKVGKRAVIFGGQLVSWSAAMTLRAAGCRSTAIVTEFSHAESYRLFNAGGRALFHTKVHCGQRVVGIRGRHQVSGVEIENIATLERSVIECDTVIFTGDWIPDSELARAAGVTINHNTLGAEVDAVGHTSKSGIFAIGNAVHPVDTADIAALSGKHAAAAVMQYLKSRHTAEGHTSLAGRLGEVRQLERIEVAAPLKWASPMWYSPDLSPSREQILTWTTTEIRHPIVAATQAGTEIGRKRLLWPASPGRTFRIPWSILHNAVIGAGPITLSIK